LVLVLDAITIGSVITKRASFAYFRYWLVAGNNWSNGKNNGENQGFHGSFNCFFKTANASVKISVVPGFSDAFGFSANLTNALPNGRAPNAIHAHSAPQSLQGVAACSSVSIMANNLSLVIFL
jgi:hypothetical protein